MESIYEKPFEVRFLPLEETPRGAERTVPAGGFLDGCRIGIDVGGSSRKVCALIDGRIVYNVTEPWQPLDHADPDYHIAELTASLKRASQALPRVDAIRDQHGRNLYKQQNAHRFSFPNSSAEGV